MKKSIKFIVVLVVGMLFITGCKEKEATNLEYAFDDAKNGYIVTKLVNKEEKKVTIPETYQKKPVIGIAKEAFKDSNIVVVHIPKTIEIIGSAAFAGCKSLVNLDISEGVKEIGDLAFKDCGVLYEVKIPNSVETMGTAIFSGCRLLEKITIPFIGKTNNSKGDEAIIGYLFGNDSQNGMSEIEQVFDIDQDGNMSNFTFAIPFALQELEITKGDKIGFGAFYNCKTLKKVSYKNEIKHIDPYAFYNCLYLSEINIPNIKGYIGEHAFEKCASLNTFTIKGDVEKIGDYAFNKCISLKTVTFEKNNAGLTIPKGCFYACDYLETVIINEGIVAIEESAFSYCHFLHKVNLPSTITIIAKQAFYKPSTTKSVVRFEIDLSKATNLTEIGDAAFANSNLSGLVVIPNKVKKIGSLAFAENKYLTGVSMLEGLEEIGTSCFSNCPVLETITIPNTVSKIGEDAFSNCPALKYETTSDGINYLGNWVVKASNKKITKAELKQTTIGIVGGAFENCELLEKVVASNNLIYVGDRAFANCTNLMTISLGEGVKYYGVYAFYGCTKLQKAYIGSNATYIGRGIFGGCTSLTSLDVPFLSSTIKQVNEAYLGFMFDADIYKNQVKYIPKTLCEVIVRKGTVVGNGAFYGCDEIEKITFVSGITFIGIEAFRDCSKLASIDLSKTITKISKLAFFNCSALKEIYIPDSVVEIGEGAFLGCEDITIKCAAENKKEGWHELWTTSNNIIWGV